MSGKAPARIESDAAESPIVSGSTDVFVDFTGLAYEGSTTAFGNTIVTSSLSVIVNNRGVARESDLTAQGSAVRTGFQDICVGD
jgi:uncharacterized Zn-binding protein involved in type VI secretion